MKQAVQQHKYESFLNFKELKVNYYEKTIKVCIFVPPKAVGLQEVGFQIVLINTRTSWLRGFLQ